MDDPVGSPESSGDTCEAVSAHLRDLQLQVNRLEGHLAALRQQLQQVQEQLQGLEAERYQHGLHLHWLEQLSQRLRQCFS